jgi:NADH:ubiquinone oxidoreductase subunit
LRVMKRFYSVKRLRKSGKVGNCNMFWEGWKSEKKKAKNRLEIYKDLAVWKEWKGWKEWKVKSANSVEKIKRWKRVKRVKRDKSMKSEGWVRGGVQGGDIERKVREFKKKYIYVIYSR